MADGKYGQYFIEDPKGTLFISEQNTEPFLYLIGAKLFADLGCTVAMVPIMRPWFMERTAMKHDFDQILCFLGGDPANLFDFQAEVEFTVGEEEEKHVIDKATAVYIPKGLIHGPLNYKVVNKPILHLDIALTTEYDRRLKTGEDEWTLMQVEDAVKASLAAERELRG